MPDSRTSRTPHEPSPDLPEREQAGRRPGLRISPKIDRTTVPTRPRVVDIRNCFDPRISPLYFVDNLSYVPPPITMLLPSANRETA